MRSLLCHQRFLKRRPGGQPHPESRGWDYGDGGVVVFQQGVATHLGSSSGLYGLLYAILTQTNPSLVEEQKENETNEGDLELYLWNKA
jgi:hypothetical protein